MKFIGSIVGTVLAGFCLGVGFYASRRAMEALEKKLAGKSPAEQQAFIEEQRAAINRRIELLKLQQEQEKAKA